MFGVSPSGTTKTMNATFAPKVAIEHRQIFAVSPQRTDRGITGVAMVQAALRGTTVLPRAPGCVLGQRLFARRVGARQ